MAFRTLHWTDRGNLLGRQQRAQPREAGTPSLQKQFYIECWLWLPSKMKAAHAQYNSALISFYKIQLKSSNSWEEGCMGYISSLGGRNKCFLAEIGSSPSQRGPRTNAPTGRCHTPLPASTNSRMKTFHFTVQFCFSNFGIPVEDLHVCIAQVWE